MLPVLSQCFAPPQCAGCRTPGDSWCASCASVVAKRRWHSIGLEVCTIYSFTGPVRRTIIDWKDERRRDAERRIVGWFRDGLWPLCQAHPDAVLVPVPASRRGERRRGGDVLFDAVRRSMPEMETASWLVSARARRDQVGLSKGDRDANLHGTLRWTGPSERHVIVVDDVLTSGATLRECARAMRVAAVVPEIGFAIAYRERGDSVASAAAGLRLP